MSNQNDFLGDPQQFRRKDTHTSLVDIDPNVEREKELSYKVYEVVSKRIYTCQEIAGLAQGELDEHLTNLINISIQKYPLFIPLYKYFTTDRLFTIFDLAERGSLHSLISVISKLSFFPVFWDSTFRYRIIFGLAYGMKFLHASHIIHRNLNPDTVLFKLNPMDSQSYDPYISGYSTPRSNFLSRIRTPFDAPEVSVNDYDTFTEKSDVYSYGMLLYLVLTARFGRPNSVSALIINKKDDIKDLPPSLGSHTLYQELIFNCCASDPSQRFTFSQITSFLSKNQSRLCSNDLVTADQPYFTILTKRSITNITPPSQIHQNINQNNQNVNKINGTTVNIIPGPPQRPLTAEERFAYIEQMAQSDPKLYTLLGVMMEKNEGCRFNIQQVEEYYRRAMEAGDPYGTLNYGNFIFQQYFETRRAEACHYIELASNMTLPDGSPFTDAKLAYCYLVMAYFMQPIDQERIANAEAYLTNLYRSANNLQAGNMLIMLAMDSERSLMEQHAQSVMNNADPNDIQLLVQQLQAENQTAFTIINEILGNEQNKVTDPKQYAITLNHRVAYYMMQQDPSLDYSDAFYADLQNAQQIDPTLPYTYYNLGVLKLFPNNPQRFKSLAGYPPPTYRDAFDLLEQAFELGYPHARVVMGATILRTQMRGYNEELMFSNELVAKWRNGPFSIDYDMHCDTWTNLAYALFRSAEAFIESRNDRTFVTDRAFCQADPQRMVYYELLGTPLYQAAYAKIGLSYNRPWHCV